MHSHVAPTNCEYRDIPVAALMESSSNPRKKFDESSLSELAASYRKLELPSKRNSSKTQTPAGPMSR